jgi:hypothetical protein
VYKPLVSVAETFRLDADGWFAGAGAPADCDVWAEGVPFRAAVPAADARGGRATRPCGWLSACRAEGRALVAGAWALTPLAHPASVAQIPAVAAVSTRMAAP